MTRALLACAAWLWLTIAHAAPVVVSLDEYASWPVRLLDVAESMEDPGGTLTIADVARLPAAGWQPAGAARAAPGTTDAAWWLRMAVRNDGAAPLELTMIPGSPRLGAVEYYVLPRPYGMPAGVPAQPPCAERAMSASPPPCPDEVAPSWPPVPSGPAPDRPPSRYPLLDFTLPAGQSADILMRVQSIRPVAAQPKLYTRTAFAAREGRAALWDGGLIGGLTALAWSALVIATLARSLPFLWLGLLSGLVAIGEYFKRGYPRIYLEPGSPFLDERVTMAILPLVGILILAFAMQLGQREGIRIPGRRWFMVLMWLAWARFVAILIVGPTPLMYTLQTLNGLLFSFSLLAAAGIMLLRRDPSSRLILASLAIGLSNIVLQLLVERGAALPALQWLDMDLEPHPLTGSLHLAGNLAIMAAWIHLVGRQRNQARDELVESQRSEQERLRREVEQRTAELNTALKYAEAQNRQKVEMLGYITHDLRAPLATISGYARLLAAAQTPRQEPHIQAIERSVGYQMALIDELLEYARGELSPLEVHSGAIDLSRLLEEVAGFAAALGTRQGNWLVYEPPAVLPRLVLLDGRRLQQVLLNLLSNAAKFTHRGTITLRLDAGPADNGWRLGFSVADTGIGIDLANRTAVFNAFQQIQHGQGGVGLGLFIAQNIVRALGGELQVESSAGTGSCFSFTLTVRVIDATPVQPRRLASGHAPSTAEPMPDAACAIPASERLHLATLARDGRLSDIEQWLSTMAAGGSGYDVFLQQVRRHLQMLDFEGIETLALASHPQA